MKYHDSWYSNVNVQELGDYVSSYFDSEEVLQYPFFPEFEQVSLLEIDIGHVTGITSLDSESQINLLNIEDTLDPKAWPHLRKVSVSILLNAFPLVVTVGTSILSPAGGELVKEFDTKSELTLLTTSLFMLVG
jgi:hypothetical protein